MRTPQTPLTHRGINLAICAVAAFIFLVLMIRAEVEDIYEQRFVIAPPLSSVTAETFSFENYNVKRHDELKSVLQKLFPPGTPKADVDHILVVKNGASAAGRRLADATIRVSYAKPAPTFFSTACYGATWIVNVYYDSNQTVSTVALIGPCGRYGGNWPALNL